MRRSKKAIFTPPLTVGMNLLSVALLCLLLTACSGSGDNDDARSKKQAETLRLIDDSIRTDHPFIIDMLKRNMAEAKDSLDYYDFYLRLMRYNVASDSPDTMLLHQKNIYAFLKSRKPSPRINGMLALLHNAEAFYAMRYNHDNKVIIKHYEKACSLLAISDNKKAMPDAYANLGDAYINANDMPKAAMLYRRALLMADSLNVSERTRIGLYMGLGRIYFNLKDFDAAHECYKKTEKHMYILPLNLQIYFLNNYGNYYYYARNYKRALEIFKKLEALLLKHNLGENYDMYVCRLNLADVYLNLGMDNESERMLKMVEPFFKKIGLESGIYYCNTIRIGPAMRHNDTETVKRTLETEKLKKPVEFTLENIRYRYLIDYYARTGNYRKAYEIQNDSIDYNESMQHNLTNMRTIEIMMRYRQDTLSLHHQIELQEKDARIQNGRGALYGVIMLAVILILLFLYFYTYNRKKSMQAHIMLMRMKLTSMRNRISPHFIFNVLSNRISSTDTKDADELKDLAKLIRANLNMSGKFYVSLREELDFVRYYVSVEQSTLDDNIVFTINAPADNVLEDILIPSMFVQILVENSIKHALRGKLGEKRLTITVERNGLYWLITVADNGPGFDIRRTNPNSTGTGLKVIRNSINIINTLNKRKITMRINNMRDTEGNVTGCRISLNLPVGLKAHFKDEP